ncbi:MAG: SGNH/GDSL hydrolase family protein, partial [Clostridia bacterium]|nr:SGNH/GDSL hydrolase family protein [Clostridia bacterium]
NCYRELLQGLKDRGTIAVCMACFDINPHIPYRATEFEAKRTIVKNLAEEFGFPYIDMKPYMMQAVADGAYKMELFGDLTHPWAAGCRIISELVVDKISAIIDEDYVTPDDLGKWEAVTATPDNEQDLTNMRPFLHCANGRIEYDTETFYNTSDFVSTQSLKAVHENKNPYHANAYTRVLFDLSDQGAVNLTQGVLTFDLKLDNFIPWVSVQAYSEIYRSNKTYQSSEYGVNFTETNKVTPLSNGWYKITIDLSQWAASDGRGVLSSAKAIVITASKGEDAKARAKHNVDGNKESVMWIDNLTINGNPVVTYYFGSDTGNMSLYINAKKATDIITFKYKKRTDGKISFAILPTKGENVYDWGNYLGYIDIVSESNFNMNGVTLTADEDGWYKVTIDIQDVTAFSGDETILNEYSSFGVLYFGSKNNATFDIKELKIEQKQN